MAATRGEVVDRGVEPVAAEEPLEGADRPASGDLGAGGPKASVCASVSAAAFSGCASPEPG